MLNDKYRSCIVCRTTELLSGVMSFALIDGFKIVAAFVVNFMMFQKAKHVFSRSHGNSVGFHANWQVCIYVCVMVFFYLFQPDIFPFFHCLFAILFVLFSFFICLLLADCLHYYCSKCVFANFYKIVPDFTLLS